MLGLVQPQDLADDDQHDDDVARYAEKLVGTQHGDVDYDNG